MLEIIFGYIMQFQDGKLELLSYLVQVGIKHIKEVVVDH
jgi:hypothetical protein